jgi:perosamine synthetase
LSIPSLKISFSDEERRWILDRINQSLANGALSHGCNVQELEKRFASYVGMRHAIAVNSGSSAIEIVMRILSPSGGEVLVPTNTFLATATGVLFAGGTVRLVDTDPKTLAVSLEELKKRATEQTVGVIIVHIGGIISPEIEDIQAWCDQQGYWLFEDAAHAHGSALDGHFAGSFGIAGSYSFFATKVMTCGEGGMVVTNDDGLAQEVALYRNHGKPEPWVSYHTHLGSNWRMNELTAPIALARLARLDEMIAARERLATRYTALLAEKIPALHPVLPQGRCSWYKYIVMLPKGVDRAVVKQQMKERGIGLAGEVYATPLHQQPVLARLAADGPYHHADDVCRRHICLPIYPDLTEEDAEQVVSTLAEVIDGLDSSG